MGGLLSIGWTLDECLDLTWDQFGFCAHAVIKHKSQFSTLIMESIGGALGVGTKGKPSNKTGKKEKPNLESQLKAAGISINKR